MFFASLNSSRIRRGVYVYVYWRILAHEEKVIALMAKVSS